MFNNIEFKINNIQLYLCIYKVICIFDAKYYKYK